MSMLVEGRARLPRPAESALERQSLSLRAAAHVTRLQLSAFRSWADADIRTSGRPVVLAGPNGSGKTAILEAVSYLAPGRGLFGAKLGDIVRRSSNAAQAWAVSADVGGSGPSVRIGTGLQRDAAGRERRVFRFDGEPAGPSEIANYIRVLWLTPALDRLFVDSAGGRRRFLDRLVETLSPGHLARLSRYEQAMAERNRLLKDGRQDPAWLDGLERTMAEEGVALAAARLHFISALNGVFAAEVSSPFPSAALALDGEFERRLESDPAVRVEAALAERLAQTRARDAAAGRTLDGPHRSDLLVSDADRDCPAELCSGGEQKALLVGIVLAHVRLVAADWGRMPILLLDEVCAFLDEARREALLTSLVSLGCQAWLSGTDAGYFRSLADHADFFDMGAADPFAPAHFL